MSVLTHLTTNNGNSKHLECGGSRYACDQPRTLLSCNVLQICAVDQTFKFKGLESGVFPEFVEKNLCKLKILRCSLVCGALLQVFQALGHVLAELPPLGDAQSALQTWKF